MTAFIFPLLYERAEEDGIPLALLGARPGRAEKCARNMKQHHPGLDIPFVHHGYFPNEEEESLIGRINESGARILLVAFGVPLQEWWITRWAPRLKVPVLLGVGALFDFFSGSVPRAPLLIRKMGIEWSFKRVSPGIGGRIRDIRDRVGQYSQLVLMIV